MELKRLMDKQSDTPSSMNFETEVRRLGNEFYSHLPHNENSRIAIDNKRAIANKQQLCQVGTSSSSFLLLIPFSTTLSLPFP